MKLTDFSIESIHLSHEQALKLKDSVIDAINESGIEYFDRKEEIQVDEGEDLDVYVTCEIYTEYSGSFTEYSEPPQAENKLSQSVNVLTILIINKEGDIVNWTVGGEKFRGESGRIWEKTPIDIEEEIKKQFTN